MMRNFIGAGLLLTLCGCVSLGGKVPPALITITPAVTISGGDARSTTPADAMTIAVPLVPQAIAVNRVVVSSVSTAIAYVKDAQWVEPPARLFQRLLAETVGAKTGKVVLDPRQFAPAAGLQLNGQLRNFGVVVANSGDVSGEAVVTYDAAMSRDRGQKVDTRRFEARVPIARIDALSVGPAINRAANKVAGDVAEWIAGR